MIIYNWLHFLHGGQQYLIGRVSPNADASEIEELLKPIFKMDVLPDGSGKMLPGSIPSLFWTVNNYELSLKSLLQLAPSILSADWGREIHLIAKYGSSLFERASGNQGKGETSHSEVL